jgi:CheY-like chemotaxis protein
MHDQEVRTLIHDLRNRIAPIRNATYLLRLKASTDPRLLDTAALIERQLQAMADLLDSTSSTLFREEESKLAENQPVSLPGTPSQGTRRILIADDSPAVCESFAAILRDLGHEVRTVNDGLEAVDAATAWVPDLVLLDINMPKLNGYEVAKRLRAQFPSSSMRLVMISGADLDSGVLAAARQAGFDECLDKLLDFSALRKLLDS